MAIDKLTPNDKRIKHQFADINGHRWHYLDAHPSGHQRGTVILAHGFPDISLAWRYQIPLLLDLGLRCIAIDCMGYGRTGTSTELKDFTFKTHADAIAGIAAAIGVPKIVLGGHDWGGMVVYRAAQWYPELVTHVFSVATPYMGVAEQYIPTEVLVKGPLPQFGYQLHFGSAEQKVEKVVRGEERIRKFLKGMYGGRAEGSGKAIMTPETGVDLEVIERDKVKMTPLLDETELDYYVAEFARAGMEGPCNWYRTRQLNFEDDRVMPAEGKKGVKQPTLFVQALNDNVLKPAMSKGMEEKIPNLTRAEVATSHWALWQTPEKVNGIIREWFEGVVFGGRSKM